MLETWVDYPWLRSREERLVELLNDVGQRDAAWPVLPAPEAWTRPRHDGLTRKQLTFRSRSIELRSKQSIILLLLLKRRRYEICGT